MRSDVVHSCLQNTLPSSAIIIYLVKMSSVTETGFLERLHTHRLFAGVESGSGRGVFHTTSIAAAGGQFDFERCTRKMFVRRN